MLGNMGASRSFATHLMAWVLLTGCGPGSAEEYRDLARTASPEALTEAWQTADAPHREMMVQGLLASDSRAALHFVLERYLADEGTSPAAAVEKVAPVRLGPALISRLDPSGARQDEKVLALMGRCCQGELLRTVAVRTQVAVESAEKGDGTLEASTRALVRTLAQVPPETAASALDDALLQLVVGLRRPAVAAGGGCSLPGMFARSGSLPVRAAAENRAADLAAACLSDGQATTAILGYLDGLDPGTSTDVPEGIDRVRARAQEAQQIFDRADSAAGEVSAAASRASSATATAAAYEVTLRTTISELGAYEFTGWIIGQLDAQHYEIARLTWVPYLGQVPSDNHLLLRTVDTTFTTTGNFQLWVAPAGSETITLQNGFSDQWVVVEERPEIPRMRLELAAARVEQSAAQSALRDVRERAVWIANQQHAQRAMLDAETGRLRAALGGLGAAGPAIDTVVETSDEATEAPVEPPATVASADPSEPQRPSPDATIAPSLLFQASSSSVGLGEDVTFTAVVMDGAGPCALRFSYVVDGEWASRSMTADDDEHSITLVVKDAMGDAMRYTIDGRCANGAVSSGSRDSPHVRLIL